MLAEEAPWPPRSRFGGLAAQASGAVLVLGGLVGPRNDVWRSRDGGSSWERLTDTASWLARWGHGVASLPSGAVVIAGGIGPQGHELGDVWQSQDDGMSWTRVLEAAPWPQRFGHCLAPVPGGAASCLLLGGSDAGNRPFGDVWRSRDGGASWECLAETAPWPRRCWFSVEALSDGSVLLMGGSGPGSQLLNDVWRTQDGGRTWKELLESAPWPARRGHGSAALPDGAVILLGGLGPTHALLSDVWRSVDGGFTWERLTHGAPWAARVDPGVASPVGGALLLLGGAATNVGPLGDVWCSDDGGGNWRQLQPRFTHLSGAIGKPYTQVPRTQTSGNGLHEPKPVVLARAAVSFPSDDPSSRSARFEDMPREQLRKAILDIQRGLSDLTRRLDSVSEENSALREENVMLKDTIDARVEGGRPSPRAHPSGTWADDGA